MLFYDEDWTNACDLCFYSDASDLAIGAVLQSHWLYLPLNDQQRAQPIAWRELFAIVVACRTWGASLAGRKVIINCDNTVAIAAVNNGTSKSPCIMTLVQSLFYIAAAYNFDVRLTYIQSKSNVSADALSRLDIEKFKSLNPDASLRPTPPITDCIYI